MKTILVFNGSLTLSCTGFIRNLRIRMVDESS